MKKLSFLLIIVCVLGFTGCGKAKEIGTEEYGAVLYEVSEKVNGVKLCDAIKILNDEHTEVTTIRLDEESNTLRTLITGDNFEVSDADVYNKAFEVYKATYQYEWFDEFIVASTLNSSFGPNLTFDKATLESMDGATITFEEFKNKAINAVSSLKNNLDNIVD